MEGHLLGETKANSTGWSAKLKKGSAGPVRGKGSQEGPFELDLQESEPPCKTSRGKGDGGIGWGWWPAVELR